MNTEVIDSFTADTIEVGDFITFIAERDGEPFDEELNVVAVVDYGNAIEVTGSSWVNGENETYLLAHDVVVHLLGTVAEEV